MSRGARRSMSFAALWRRLGSSSSRRTAAADQGCGYESGSPGRSRSRGGMNSRRSSSLTSSPFRDTGQAMRDDGRLAKVPADVDHPRPSPRFAARSRPSVAPSPEFVNLARRCSSRGGHRTPFWPESETASAIRSPTSRASDRPHRAAGLDRNSAADVNRWPDHLGNHWPPMRRITQAG